MDLARFIYNLNFFPLSSDKNKFTDSETYSSLISVRSFFENYLKLLLNFINCSEQNQSKIDLTILELGCGHGLPALSVIKLLEDLIRIQIDNLDGQVKCNEEKIDKSFTLNIIVYMQDFNKQILEGITFENSKKLVEQTFEKISFCYNNLFYKIELTKSFKFVYGDWRDLLEKNLLPKQYFNLILTSETIYNSQNYRPLIGLFKECLCRETANTSLSIKGLILLSAKTYYFGCGGNLHEFLSLLKSDYGEFFFSKNLLFDSILNFKIQSLKTTSQNSSEKNSPNSDNQVYSLNQFKKSNRTPINEDDSELYSSNISKEIIKICFKN